jgi:hypothetical protein
MIRTDVKTGRRYINNIPEGRINAITTSNGVRYKIITMNAHHQEDSWYDGKFIGDDYSVALYVKPDKGCGFWQQVSRWTARFGNAEREMFRLAKEAEKLAKEAEKAEEK